MTPQVSVVVTAYNRVDLLRRTLENLGRACAGVEAEILVVDDGSESPVEPELSDLTMTVPLRVIRQDNSGSAAARQRGVLESAGEYVFVSDSDDLVDEAKLRDGIDALERHQADVCYSDEANARITASGDPQPFSERHFGEPRDLQQLLVRLIPRSNNCIWRGDWIRAALREPVVPPRRAFGPAGDSWLYLCAAVQEGTFCHVQKVQSYMVCHDDARETGCWEKLGVSSLLLLEEFAEACPGTPAGRRAREEAAIAAFRSWRRLPRDYPAEFSQRLIEVYRRLGGAPVRELGEGQFRRLASVIGPVAAGKLLRRLQRPPYERVGTLGRADLMKLLGAMPSPGKPAAE